MNKTYYCALVPLSADPITYGHLYIIRQAVIRCKNVIVLISQNNNKNYLFPLVDRINMVKKAVATLDNVEVIGSDDALTADVYLKHNCDVIIRGIRDERDSNYEHQLAEMNQLMYSNIRTHFITSPEDYKNISSTFVKECVKYNVDVSKYVPVFVKQKLEEAILGQYKIGITGSIAVGKSYVARSLVNAFEERNVDVLYVSMDNITRELYQEDTPGGQWVREFLANQFDDKVLSSNRKSVNRIELRKRFFGPMTDQTIRNRVFDKLLPHIERLYRAQLKGFKGIVLLEHPLIFEKHQLGWTNNNVIIVNGESVERYKQRGIVEDELAIIKTAQMPFEDKMNWAEHLIHRDNHGAIFKYNNIYQGEEHHQMIQLLAQGIIDYF